MPVTQTRLGLDAGLWLVGPSRDPCSSLAPHTRRVPCCWAVFCTLHAALHCTLLASYSSYCIVMM